MLVGMEKFVRKNAEQFEVSLLFIAKDERLLFLREVKELHNLI